jgi:four helix bundle protein
MQDFKNLSVWQSARLLTRSVYGITARYPENETYGLTSQMRRAAVSICANIAESCGRGSDADAKRFLHAAMGSACELESHSILSADLSMITAQVHGRLVEEIVAVKKMLAGLIRQLAVKTKRESATR